MRLLGKMIEVAAVLTLFILVIMTIAAVIMRYCFHMPLQDRRGFRFINDLGSHVWCGCC